MSPNSKVNYEKQNTDISYSVIGNIYTQIFCGLPFQSLETSMFFLRKNGLTFRGTAARDTVIYAVVFMHWVTSTV